MLSEQARFDPATARRRFRIAAINYVQVMLLATLLKRLATTVPMIDFEIRQASVEAGVLDLLIRPHRQVTGSFGRRFTTTVTVAWTEHAAKRLTLSGFAAMEHVLVAPRERPGGIVDEVLERNKLSRRVAGEAAAFLFLPSFLLCSPRLAPLAERPAQKLTGGHPPHPLHPPTPSPKITP